MSAHVCPCCGKRYHDLGWHNDPTDRPAIDVIERRCKDLDHHRESGPRLEVDLTESIHPYKGFEHTVSCHICKYIYRYDSSD